MSEATNMKIIDKSMCYTHHFHGSCMIREPEFPLIILTRNSVNHMTCTSVIHCIHSLECNVTCATSLGQARFSLELPRQIKNDR